MEKLFKFSINTFFIATIIGIFLLFMYGFYGMKGDIFKFICFIDCSLIGSSFLGAVFVSIAMELNN